MSCSPFDLRDYFLNELPEPARREVDAHVKTCATCREEMDQLRLTEAALFALRDEEIPQRIAFVSDPVFERSPWRRWFDAFWGSAARLGFASAVMLSTAILVFALTRPAPAPVINMVAPPAPSVIVQAATPTPAPPVDNQQQLRLIAEMQTARRELQLAEALLDRYQRENRRLLVANAGYGPKPETGGPQ